MKKYYQMLGKLLLLNMGLFIATSVKATPFDKTFSFKDTLCKFGRYKVSVFLRFDKKLSSDEEHDYSGAPLIYLKTNHYHAVEAKPDDFSFIKPSEESVCENTQGYALDRDTLAILYSRDNRPNQDFCKAVVWNLKSDKLVSAIDLGAGCITVKIKNGFAFSTSIPRSDGDQFEFTTPSGKKTLAMDSGDLGFLKTVHLKDNKLEVTLDRDLSYEKSPWKKFFRNKDQYLKAAGWDEAAKEFKNIVVYEATYFNRKESDIQESCIAMAKERVSDHSKLKWICVKEKQ